MQVPPEQQQHFPAACACAESVNKPGPEAGLTPELRLPARSTVSPPDHWGSRQALCSGSAAGSPGGRPEVLLQLHRTVLGHCESETAKGGRPAAGRHETWREPARVAAADLVFWVRLRSPRQPLPFPLAPAAPRGPAAAVLPTGHAAHWGDTPADERTRCFDSHRQHAGAQQALQGSLSQK